MTRSRLNAWFEKVEDDIHISMELDSSETMKRFVEAGLGVSFPRSLKLCRGSRGRRAQIDPARSGADDA